MPVSDRNIALLCNPTIEKAIRIADEVALLLRDKGMRVSIFTAYWPTVWDDFSEAWIVGGDGTVNYFINQNPDFALPIALFAGGSGNDLHWMLYGETTVAAQVDFFLNAHAAWIDAGACNGTLFLNGVGIGFDGMIVKSMLGKKKIAGKASYLLAVMKHIFLYREKSYTITYQNNTFTQDCLMVSVANGKRYGGGFQVTPKASVTDALLDVMTVGAIDATRRLRYLPAIERGAHLDLSFVKYAQIRTVIIEAASPLPAHIDGEFLTAERFEVSVLIKRFSFLL